MSGSYELSMSSNGQFRFVLKADDEDTLIASELYKTKSAAENGIESMQDNCRTEARYEKKESSNGKFYFNLKAANHQVIGTSQLFASEALRDHGIELVKANGATETIRDLTVQPKTTPAGREEERRM